MSFRPRFGMPTIQATQFVSVPYGAIPMVPVVQAHYILPTMANPMLAGHRPLMKRPPTFVEPTEKAPATTVFVGNIHERASNELLKSLLNRCGGVTQWKRVHGSNNRFQAFGFCEFDHPDATLRAIRLLNDFNLGGKKLSIKADEKTREIIKEFINKRRTVEKKVLLETTNLDEISIEEFMRENVNNFQSSLKQIVQDANDPELLLECPVKELSYESNAENTSQLILPETEEAEKEKLEYIEREIKHFRSVHKEVDPKKTSSHRREHRRSRSRSPRGAEVLKAPSSTDDASATKRADKSPVANVSSRESSLAAKRAPSVDRRRHSPPRKRSHSKDAATRSPSRSRRRRSRSRSRRRDSDEEEEVKERKRLEKKIREKEYAYQERLKKWESRERKKAQEHDKERTADKRKRKEDLKEAKKLKEFFEDYDDETEDPKYYKGKSYEMRRREFERERDLDNRDRQKEKDELEEIRRKLLSEGVEDPDQEILRLQKEQEEKLLKRLRADESDSPSRGPTALSINPADQDSNDDEEVTEEEMEDEADSAAAFVPNGEHSMNKPNQGTPGPCEQASSRAWRSVADSSVPDTVHQQLNSSPSTAPPKPLGFAGLRLTASSSSAAVRHESPNSDGAGTSPKRRLVPLEYTDEERRAVNGDEESMAAMSVDQKRQAIKALIERIPTSKEELFAYPVEWALVDSVLVEKRLKPWVNKKIVEYIGEEEASLVDFICQKVGEKSPPQAILEDISMVLDDEASVFVIKLWRLLIYEIEAKRYGLVKLD